MAEIEVQGVSKVFPDGTEAVSALDLKIPDGDLVVLVGPSGCGKTTLLRMVAGLEQPTAGTISIGGEVVNDMPPKHRDIAMVFQNYALYPHMSVYDNMAYALRRRRERKDAIERRVTETARMLGLTEHLKKKPAALSGGQRQRVAMGRAIVREPKAFLMDEPLSNLDAKLRVEMRSEIMRIQRDLGVTTVFVTHDQTEALTMGDLVVVMRGGVVQQFAPPGEIFARPANLFVAGFIGSPPMNLARARIEQGEGGLVARLASTVIPVPDDRREQLAPFAGREVALGIRPEDFRVDRIDPAMPSIEAVVELRETLGRERYLHFTIDAPPAVTGEARELLADTDVIALEKLEAAAERNRTHMVARVPASQADTDAVRLGIDVDLVEFFDLDNGRAIR